MSDANIEIATQVSDSLPAANSWSVVWGDYTLSSMNNIVSINQLTDAMFGGYDFETNLHNGGIIGKSDQLRTFSGDAAPLSYITYDHAKTFPTPCTVLRPSNEGIAVKNAAGIRTDYVLHGQQAARNAGALTLPRVPNTLAFWNCDLSHRRLCAEPVMRLVNFADITPADPTDTVTFMRLSDYESQVLVDPGIAGDSPFLYDHQLAVTLGVDIADVVTLFPFERAGAATLMVDISSTVPAGYVLPNVGTGAVSDELVRYVHKMTSKQDWAFGLFMAVMGLEITGHGVDFLPAQYRVYTPEYSFGSHLISVYAPDSDIVGTIGLAEFLPILKEVGYTRHLMMQYVLQAAGSAIGVPVAGFNYAVQRRATWNLWISTALGNQNMPYVPWEYMSVYRDWKPKDIRTGILHPTYKIQVATTKGMYRSMLTQVNNDRNFLNRGNGTPVAGWVGLNPAIRIWVPIAQNAYNVETGGSYVITSRAVSSSNANNLELPSVSQADDWLPELAFLDLN